MDERGGPAGFVNLLKPTTGHSNMTRMTKMTRMTNQTGVTRVNAGGVQPYIDKVRLKSKFDATSKLDASSAQTRKYNSNLRGGLKSHSRRLQDEAISASGHHTVKAANNQGRAGKNVTIANNTNSQMNSSIKFGGGPGGTIENPVGTNLPEIVSPGKHGIPTGGPFNRDQSRRKYSRLAQNSRGSIQTESPAINKFGAKRGTD